MAMNKKIKDENKKEKYEKKKNKKFNKNTIRYVEAIVYILAIIVAIFACNCGPIYIKMLPILFVLGFVGRIIFDRPVITTIFGIVTAVCIIKITSNISLFDNFFISLCDGLNIALGELFGEYFLKSKKLFDKKKKLKTKGVFFTYLITSIVFVISIGVHIYTNGNYISYIKARVSLYNYLSDTYFEQNFSIVNCKYTFYKTKSYNFEVKNTTKNINTNFIVLKNNDYAVYDEYKFRTQSKNNTKLNSKFNEYIKSLDTNLELKVGYLDSGKIKVLISKKVENVDKNSVNEFALEVNKIIVYLKDFEEYSKINNVEISLIDKKQNSNSLVSDFILKDIENQNNIYEYILNSLDLEFID